MPTDQEAIDWIKARGFKLVVDVLRGGYVKDFDRNKEYQFMRADWDEPVMLRLADCHPMMNVWGLYFRP